jgi:hypothetical protein
MSSYYQLAKIGDGIDEIFRTAFNRNLNPDTIDLDTKNKFVALQLTPDNLNNFDNAVKDLKIDNVVFSTFDFERIMNYAFENNIKIRDVKTNELQEDLSNEFNQLLRERDTDKIVNFIKSNDVDIKELELSFETSLLRFYDSGIFWVERDYSDTERFPKSLFKKLLKLIV